jgi:hypothetical protein
MADKRISQLIERVDIANNDVLPIVASGATTTNKVTISTIQEWMQDNLDVGVTSVGITIGSTGTDINVTGSPVTTSGNITINIPTASATNRGLLSSSDWTSFNSKLSSVGLTMPSAFTVSNSPLTANGTIAVTGAGTVAQYIRGDGSLADFPEAGGGGASVSYYLNGSVSQGTIGGIAYREMNKTPILGAGTDFTIAADGYIASFITDAGDPNLLLIPGGNWNLETYFAASSGGGSPSFYVELYKVDSGGTATLIASNSANPELIAFGTTTTAYFSSLAVPPTVLTLTDRLALRYYVTHAGRTITMHTEDANLCQVITTFTTGLTALNGLTAQVQNFATGTSGTDFNISSSSATHTFNIPDASASNRGAVTTGSQIFGGVKTFANGLSLSAVGGSNQVTRIVNIGTLHEGSATLNQIGFNSGNNIYFGKGLSNGGVISWNNAAVRYYTLPDADGTIALTSDLGNYIQGVGTADSIPKFTAARTLANSAIRDTTSTVVISKNVSVDNGASQAINLTPASGGTTNRIETTGTLPLSIITSGSSITLAAGGVTPQITLASTGAVTLTGALNGTSASFTGAVTSTGTGLNPSVRLTNTTASTGTDWHLYSLNNGNLGIYNNTAGAYSLQIASTGAATFSSSVTATSGVFTTGITLQGAADTSILNTYSVGGTIYGYNGVSGATNSIINGSVLGDLVIRSQNKSILFSTNGGSTSAVTITSTGNVGIGTASPSCLFQARGSDSLSANSRNLKAQIGGAGTWGSNSFEELAIGFSGIRSTYTSGDNWDLSFAAGTSTTFAAGTQPERMRITSGGNVGIGTANPTTYSLNGRHLEVNDAGQGHAFIHNNTTSVKSFYATNESLGASVLYTFSNHPLLLGTNNTERMRITSGGNVGIGTASPSARLDVFLTTGTGYQTVGRFLGGTNANGNAGGIVVGTTQTGAGYIYGEQTASNEGALVFGTQTSGAYAERMRITSGGSILFGTQTMSTTHAYFDNAGSSRMVLNLGSSVTTNANLIAFNNPNGNVGTIATSGSSTSYNTTSDYRLKENVKPVENALSKLSELKPCTFNFIADAKEEVMGFLAHEVQEVMPQAVHGQKDAVEIKQVEVSPAELDEEGNIITEAVIEEKEVPVYQGIDHSKLVPLLVASIQELKAEIEALKSQING